MQIIENSKVKEKLYVEKLENGLTVMIVPKVGIRKKYVIWGTNYGSNESKFVVPGENNETEVPKGVAHFLEHKMFEQESGVNSLDTLTALGVEANAYTTNDHTAYLFECTENFYPALDELMDYVQHPYFTDENVEKEKGIIGQEIRMYDDDPSWQLYINTMDCLYKNNPIKIDIAGTQETIAPINPQMLYTCYNNFYHPSNMVLVVVGDFEPKELLEEIKKRLIPKEKRAEIKRIYPEEPSMINKKEKEVSMDVSQPLFMIGIKVDSNIESKEKVKEHIAIEIILNMLLGKSSKLFDELYEKNLLLDEPSMEFEFSKEYAHILICAQSKNPKEVYNKILDEIKKLKESGINEADFERIKKKIYGDYVIEYNNVGSIGRMFVSDSIKGINSFDYINEFDDVDEEYTKKILENVFDESKTVISIVNPV